MAFSPLYMKESVFSVAADDFAAEITSVAFTPSSSVATWKGLKPSSVFTEASSPTWTCDLTYAQDWDTPTSISNYLFENQGARVEVTFKPKAGGRAWTATIIITPGAIGGAIDSHVSSTVSLGVQGAPVPAAFPV